MSYIHNTSTTEANNSVGFLSCGQSHSISGDRIELLLNPLRLECSDRIGGHSRHKSVGATGKVLHCQQIRRDGDESIGSELICYCAHPVGQPEDLVDDDHHWRFRTPLGIHHPCVKAVSIASLKHYPFGVSRRSTESCPGSCRIRRKRA